MVLGVARVVTGGRVVGLGVARVVIGGRVVRVVAGV